MRSFIPRRIFGQLILVAALLAPAASHARDKEFFVYFGTYTGKKSKGIYVSRLNATDGKLSSPELAAEVASPSFLAVHPDHKFVFAVNEVGRFEGKTGGGVSAFAVDAKGGMLTLLNQQGTGGAGPCHVSVDHSGRVVLVANYGGGSVASYPLSKDGRIGPVASFVQHHGSSANKSRQDGPHGHCFEVDPSNRFALACDLGLDQVRVYRLDPKTGTLTPNVPAFGVLAPGSGPRHLAFHRSGDFVYVINEILCTVTAFSFDSKKGELKELQTLSSLPAGVAVDPSYSTAEIIAHPSGKFIYGSNRGHDTLAVFSVNAKTGMLTLVEHVSTRGKIPRGFGIDPTGAWLLAGNQNSDSVVEFGIDSKTGRLTPTGQVLEVGSPVSVVFLPVP